MDSRVFLCVLFIWWCCVFFDGVGVFILLSWFEEFCCCVCVHVRVCMLVPVGAMAMEAR